ncbi:MAG: PAQR family membrane homeostasis protein TrhA, partial [Sporichthyaceae bacterium]
MNEGRTDAYDEALTGDARTGDALTGDIDPSAHAPTGPIAFVAAKAEAVVEAIKPHLRGWLHLGMFPISVIAGFVLVAIPQEPRARLASAVFAGTAALLFGISALYHRGTWGPRTREFLKRFDHANIFLIIAGSYTPFALLLLSDKRATLMLVIVWSGALLGVLLRSVWVNSARWLSAPVYICLGWTAAFFVPDLL